MNIVFGKILINGVFIDVVLILKFLFFLYCIKFLVKIVSNKIIN